MTELRPGETPTSPWERRIAMGSGLVAGGLVLTVLGTYLYGNSQEPSHRGTASIHLDAPAADVTELLHDMERRPEWRPQVVRIGRKSDPTDEREVWRELDGSDDRFDIEVVERGPGRLVLRTDAPEQVGYEATWSFQVSDDAEGSRLTLVEEGFVDNPLYRGVFWLRGGPVGSVQDELVWVAQALGAHAPERPEVALGPPAESEQ